MAELIPTITARAIDEKITADNILDKTLFPTISTGTAAPTTTPTKIGNIFIDTTAKKFYFANGTTASTDWIITN